MNSWEWGDGDMVQKGETLSAKRKLKEEVVLDSKEKQLSHKCLKISKLQLKL